MFVSGALAIDCTYRFRVRVVLVLHWTSVFTRAGRCSERLILLFDLRSILYQAILFNELKGPLLVAMLAYM